MADKRNVEVFSAGCPLCEDAVALVEEVAGSAHEVHVRDTNEEAAARRARALGIRAVPTVVIDGEVADCCTDRGINERALRESLEGQAQSQPAEDAPRARRGCC